MLVIESSTPEAAPLGYVAYQRRLGHGLVSVRALELRRGVPWLAPAAAVVAHLDRWVRDHPDGPGRGIRMALPEAHPAMRCIATRLGAGPPGSYGLYVRVPDVIALLRVVTPVLEARLAASPATGWTGDLHVGLYDDGLRLRFDAGRLGAIEQWMPPADGSEGAADARLPKEAFLNLLFGNRPIGDVERTTADCLLETDTGALLLDVLFPVMPWSTWELC